MLCSLCTRPPQRKHQPGLVLWSHFRPELAALIPMDRNRIPCRAVQNHHASSGSGYMAITRQDRIVLSYIGRPATDEQCWLVERIHDQQTYAQPVTSGWMTRLDQPNPTLGHCLQDWFDPSAIDVGYAETLNMLAAVQDHASSQRSSLLAPTAKRVLRRYRHPQDESGYLQLIRKILKCPLWLMVCSTTSYLGAIASPKMLLQSSLAFFCSSAQEKSHGRTPHQQRP